MNQGRKVFCAAFVAALAGSGAGCAASEDGAQRPNDGGSVDAGSGSGGSSVGSGGAGTDGGGSGGSSCRRPMPTIPAAPGCPIRIGPRLNTTF